MRIPASYSYFFVLIAWSTLIIVSTYEKDPWFALSVGFQQISMAFCIWFLHWNLKRMLAFKKRFYAQIDEVLKIAKQRIDEVSRREGDIDLLLAEKFKVAQLKFYKWEEEERKKRGF